MELGSPNKQSNEKREDDDSIKTPKWEKIYRKTGKTNILFRGSRNLQVQLTDVRNSKLRFSDKDKTRLNVRNLTNNLILTYLKKRCVKKPALETDISKNSKTSFSESLSIKIEEKKHAHKSVKTSFNNSIAEQISIKKEKTCVKADPGSLLHTRDLKNKQRPDFPLKTEALSQENILSLEMTSLEKKLFAKTNLENNQDTILKKMQSSKSLSSGLNTSLNAHQSKNVLIPAKKSEKSKMRQDDFRTNHERSKVDMIIEMKRKEKLANVMEKSNSSSHQIKTDLKLSSATRSDFLINQKVNETNSFWLPDSDTKFGLLEKQRNRLTTSQLETIECEWNEDAVVVSRGTFPDLDPIEFSKSYYDLNIKSFNSLLRNFLIYYDINSERCALIKTSFSFTAKQPNVKNNQSIDQHETNLRRRGQDSRNYFIHHLTTHNINSQFCVEDLQDFTNFWASKLNGQKTANKIEIFSGGFLGINYQDLNKSKYRKIATLVVLIKLYDSTNFLYHYK
jgi:hypothetical protein